MVGVEHRRALAIESQSDAYHQVIEENVGRLARAGWCFERGAVNRVAERRVDTVRPVEHASSRIDLQVDRLGQVVIKQFDILSIRRRLAARDLDICAKDSSLAGVISAFL